jgi:large subunit ribosomal protein L18
MSIFRSHKHIACQLIDDFEHKTLVSASTRDNNLGVEITYGGNKDAAQTIGKVVAERALSAGIKSVRLDRGHVKYHGRVAALADAAREAGLEF